MRQRILVVARDVTHRSALARWLISAGYIAEGVKRAREVLANHKVALTILVRGRLSAPPPELSETGDKLTVVVEESQDGAAVGSPALSGDRYVSIPFDDQQVLASVKAVLRSQHSREDEVSSTPALLVFDGFTIDLAGHVLLDRFGSEVPLTRSEFTLLVALARNAGRVLSRDQLLDVALGRRAEPYDRSIDVLIGRLRRKIEPDLKVPRLIVTVLGEGYKFAAKLREGLQRAEPAVDSPAKEQPQARRESIERRQLTVVSCGFVGSTALASQLDPEDLRAVIADYDRCCTEVIDRFGGMVVTFPDDRILAYFGYPEAHEDDAEKAVRAGLALVDAVAQLDIQLPSPPHVRVGIASGIVVLESADLDVASHERLAIGEPPALAFQLLSLAPPDAVVIASSTRHLVPGFFDYREAGSSASVAGPRQERSRKPLRSASRPRINTTDRPMKKSIFCCDAGSRYGRAKDA